MVTNYKMIQNICEEIKKELFDMQDTAYGEFQCKLMPTVEKDSVIGVRTPELKKYAKVIAKRIDADEFLHDLPHKYYDENQLHGFILCEMKDYDKCMEEVNRFLPYVDNWATCDTMLPKVFKKHHTELLEQISIWLKSDKTYTLRFGIKMLMNHFLDEDFALEYPTMVSKIRSDEYYVNMMIAWYFATALAKQYDAVLPFIEKRTLDVWTHNKSIQKSVESYRITNEQKEYLKSLKIKK